MRAGNLDRLITIQRKTVAPSGSGEPVETWTDLACKRPASMRPVKGDERFASDQLVGVDQIEFRVRYSSNISDLTPQDRIIHPPVNEGDDIPERRIHDIIAIHEIGRREGLQIIAVRRADVTS